MQCLVARDEVCFLLAFAVDGRGGVVGGGTDGVEPYQAVYGLFTQYVFAVELGHLGVLGFLLDLIHA